MNVFEDLIVELKEANLLEKTVMEIGQPDTAKPKASQTDYDLSRKDSSVPDKSQAEYQPRRNFKIESAGLVGTDPAAAKPMERPIPTTPGNGPEFYKKRAVGEVSNLKMVEHVLTGVEREYIKVVPNAFNDFNAKKALHAFLNVDGSENSDHYTEAEFQLMSETEAWCTALAARDAKMPVASVRLYCESSRPPLSSQALEALARFYRNLPYTEPVRAKFDFVMTRLFSRRSENGTRVALFPYDEILSRINTLYGEWSSIALYSAGDDDSNVMLAALSFEDLAIEAENSSTFDRLIESDFFSRLRLFKESLSEVFYAPHVTSAAIECNIRVGNAYFKLLAIERQKIDAEGIYSKYGDMNDQAASDAAAHTLDLVGIIGPRPDPVEPAEAKTSELEPERIETPEPEPSPLSKPEPSPNTRPTFFGNLWEKTRSINKWFLGTSIALIAGSIGFYNWANYTATEVVTTAGVNTVQIENTAFKQHVQMARVSGDTFYALMQPSWDLLPQDKRREILQNIYQTAREKGCNQVSLTSSKGKPAGYASATRVEAVMP